MEPLSSEGVVIGYRIHTSLKAEEFKVDKAEEVQVDLDVVC